MPLQVEETVAEQVGGRLAAAEEDEQVHRDQLVLGHGLLVAVVEHQPGQLGTLAGGAVPAGPSRRRTSRNASIASSASRSDLSSRENSRPTASDHSQISSRSALRNADQVDDDPHRQLVGEMQLDVGLRLALHLLDEVVDVPLHRLAQQLDPPGGERARRDPAQPRRASSPSLR